jgi:hypothetical protein
MQSNGLQAIIGTPAPDGRTVLQMLVGEARRQPDVCNACRYCKGLCAVFPAMERSPLDPERISHWLRAKHHGRHRYGRSPVPIRTKKTVAGSGPGLRHA